MIEEMLEMPKRKINYKTYKNKFEQFVKNKVEVTGVKYDKEVSEIIEHVEDYKQCYNPHFKIRKQLPKYWFISKEGFLINVKGKRPRWVRPNLDSGRPQFKPSASLPNWVGNKGITTYDLVALTWGSFISPDAEYLLDTVGADVIGYNQVDERKLHVSKVQGHHWLNEYIHENSIENYIKNNDPENIQIITNREHHILEELAKGDLKGSTIFYQPQYRNVRSEEPIVYILGEKPRLARLSDFAKWQKIVVSCESMFLEKDSCVIGDYLFIGTDMREYFEENKEYFKNVSQHFAKDKGVILEYVHCGVTMYYQYIGK